MAKSHSGGPGTYSSHGVNCTMDAPFKQGLKKAEGNGMKAPFDGGVSNPFNEKVYDNLGGMAKASPTQTAPSAQGQKRSGTQSYPEGGKTRDGGGNR